MANADQALRLAVFGQPIAQSLSPEIHSRFARQVGLNVDYRAIEASPEAFPAALARLAEQGARGCNITAPLKRDAWRLAARCSDAALRAQAANTLVFYGAREWFADNTDGRGLVNDLESLHGLPLADMKILLLGAGGAAAGVLGALLHAAPEFVVVANRTVERAVDLAETHSDLGTVRVATPERAGDHGPFGLIVNATSLGHRGERPPVRSEWFADGALCYDMNYGPAADVLKDWCSEQHLEYRDGLGMLVGQAALSFHLWTGKMPNTEPVLAALRR